MKKFALYFVLALVLVMALPATAQDDVEMVYEDVDPTGATVQFWHQHSGEREEALMEIVNEFNTTNEWGITVEASNQGGYGDIFQKMNLGLVEGGESLPQLVVAYQNQAATYQLVDGLVDMRALVDSPTWGLSEEDKADFFAGFYNSDVFPTFGGQRLGFPPNRSMEVMYYNIDWLAELYESGAISFEGAPQTPDQFREAACAAVENPYSGATGDVSTSVGYQLSFDASRLASWTFAFGGDVFDYDAGVYTYDSEAAVEAVTFLQGLFADGCATDIPESFGDQTNFGQGVTLFTVGSSSGFPFYRSAVEEGAAFDWSVAPLPHTTEEPVMNLYGASVSIPRSTPQQELAAWLFVKYYTDTEAQGTWARASNYFPVRASVAEGLADYFESDPAYATAFDLLQYTVAEPPVPGYDFVRDEAEGVLAAIVGDPSMDVAAALGDLTELSNEILADQ
jgi:multiple sugar transport system substrate-binding protein/sn-glycerol 3-phosphate transport system substrate-binding protein